MFHLRRVISSHNFSTNIRSISFNQVKSVISHNIPYISLAIGAFALGFQTMVLHPWHEHLSEQFEQLQKEIDRLDQVSSELTTKMEQIVEIGREVKAKERQNMHTSQEILKKLEETKGKMHKMHQPITPMD